jgi:hypothetical protein
VSRRGWTPLATRSPLVRRYARPGTAGGFTLITPATSDGDDYAEAVARALELLSRVEERSAYDILAQVSTPSDVIRAQVASVFTRDGTIPLSKCLRLVHGMQDLVTYSACAEVLPTPVPFHARKLKEALQLSEKARFGQTEVGSFIATLYFPVPIPEPPPASPQTALFPPPPQPAPPLPPERRVTARIVRGLAKVAEAARAHDHRVLVDGYSDGFSSNMCESLSSLFGAFPGGSCTFSADFDPIYAPPTDVPAGPITISTDAVPMLNEAAERLQPTEPPRPAEVDGYVTTLHHDWRGGSEGDDDDDADTEPFRVWVMWNDRGHPKKVQFDLDPETHTMAVDAYRNKARVKVEGTLERHGRKWVLLNPAYFRIG